MCFTDNYFFSIENETSWCWNLSLHKRRCAFWFHLRWFSDGAFCVLPNDDLFMCFLIGDQVETVIVELAIKLVLTKFRKYPILMCLIVVVVIPQLKDRDNKAHVIVWIQFSRLKKASWFVSVFARRFSMAKAESIQSQNDDALGGYRRSEAMFTTLDVIENLRWVDEGDSLLLWYFCRNWYEAYILLVSL